MSFIASNAQPGVSLKDHATPFKIALTVVIEAYLKNDRKPELEKERYTEKEERLILILMLQLVQVCSFERFTLLVFLVS